MVCKKYITTFVLLALLCCSVRLQTCSNSSTQATIKFTSYTNGSAEFASSDIAVDSNMNQYLVYSYNGFNQDVHITKINSNGGYDWSMRYPSFAIKNGYKSTQISSDGTTLRMIGADSTASCQFVQISTGDGSVLNSNTCNAFRFNDDPFQTSISCSSNAVCYFITHSSSNFQDHQACKVDFSSTGTITYSDPSGADHHLSGIAALNDDQVIVGGFNLASTARHFFYSHDFNNSNQVWIVESATLEDTYSSESNRRVFSFVNDDSSKVINVLQGELFPIVIVLNPADGSLIDARKIEFSQTYSSAILYASGRISNNMVVASMLTFSPSNNSLAFVNTDTWEVTSYVCENFVIMNGFSSLFNTDQTVLLLQFGSSSNFFTLQTSYDKLHITEMCNQTTVNVTNVTDNFGFGTVTLTITETTENPGALNLSPAPITLSTDSDKTYEVTANIFSSSVANVSGDINSTTLGPLEFDCYTVTTSATNANFSNQLEFTPNNGQTIPSWMTFDSSTAGISLASPEISSGNYTVKNSYTGVYVNFTLDTNVSISITEVSTQNNNDDDDYCLGASSKGLCAFFVILIIFAVLGPIILFVILIYVKHKCCKGSNDRTRLEQEQPNEEKQDQQDNNDQEFDESVQMNQYRNIQPNTETGAAVQVEEVEINQV